MSDTLTWLLAGLAAGPIVSSFFEWAIHRYVMHRPVGKFRYPFEAHAIVHHQTFKADETYHLVKEHDKETIPMAWWNGPVLIAICSSPVWIAALILGSAPLAWGGIVSCGLYYLTYEYIHWCMHLPKQRRMEKGWWFRRLNGHHLLHHRYMHKNFNVVMPLADALLGTLLVRSKTKFAQAKGPSVPNVQPAEIQGDLAQA
jgi:Fatty acid hydroxylase superfamily